MEGSKRIAGLFKDLYNGQPWLDVTITGTLKDLTVTRALFRISPERNSIWEIVNHMINWRDNVLQRLQGKTLVTPAHNYFEPVKDTSSVAWQHTLQKFENSQKQWLEFLNAFEDADLDNINRVNQVSHYKHIHGIMQHDAYHLGQVVLLSRLAEEKEVI